MNRRLKHKILQRENSEEGEEENTKVYVKQKQNFHCKNTKEN